MTLTDAELAAALGANQALASRLLETSTALVERYAPDAPEAVQNESVIRMSGWLVETPHAGVSSETTGDVRTGFDGARALSALRHSGAMALLSPWKIRRAGVI